MSAPKLKTNNHELARVAELSGVTDSELSDVSIMTVGPARGHGMRVDEKTISQFITHVLGKSISSYLTHKGSVTTDETGAPMAGDRLGNEIGMFSGFYRDGETVRAKQFKFLDSFIEDEPKLHSRLVDLARTAADQLGISPVVQYIRAWVREDGSEVPDGTGGIPVDLADELPAMRIRRVLSLDFVKSPATNLGLFDDEPDAPDALEETSNPDPKMKEEISSLNEQLAAKSAELASLQAAQKAATATLENTHAAALSAKDASIATLTEQAKKDSTELATLREANGILTKQRDEAKLHDMRFAGAPALAVALESQNGGLPNPAPTAQARWEQYASLCDEEKNAAGVVINHKETPRAKRFREQYISGKA